MVVVQRLRRAGAANANGNEPAAYQKWLTTQSAGLLVMGAYGHSRIRQLVLR